MWEKRTISSASKEKEAWESIQRTLSKIPDIPIRRYPDEMYTDKDLITILRKMRELMDYVAAHPGEEDPYEVSGAGFEEEYAILLALADYRGLVIEDNGKSE